MENDPDLMAFNNWRAVQPDFLARMRAEARARGITLLVNRAPYSRQELRQAINLISGGRGRLRQLGFDLQAIAGPTPEFFGLTVQGAVLGDEGAMRLPPHLVASVRDELAVL